MKQVQAQAENTSLCPPAKTRKKRLHPAHRRGMHALGAQVLPQNQINTSAQHKGAASTQQNLLNAPTKPHRRSIDALSAQLLPQQLGQVAIKRLGWLLAALALHTMQLRGREG